MFKSDTEEPTDAELASLQRSGRRIKKAIDEFLDSNDRTRRGAYDFLKKTVKEFEAVVDGEDDEYDQADP